MFELNQITRVLNIDQINIDSLLDVSMDSMNNGTFVWPADVDTNEEKREYYKKLMSTFLVQHDFFGFKRTVNGVDVSFNLGRVSGTTWNYAHALVGTLNGSRSWIFDENITPQQTQFLYDNGFRSVMMSSYGNSAVLQHQIKKYQLLGDQVKITENWEFNESNGILKTKVDFISSSFHNAVIQSDTRLH